MSDRRSQLIIAVLALAGTTFALLQSVVVPALPEIDRALGAGSAGGTWVLTANLLATAVLTPLLGRLGDMHGKDRVLTGVMSTLGVGTLVCALAPSLPVMLAGRALQGAGGAVFPLAFGIVRDELPRDRVPGAVGLVSSLLGIGAGLGLVLSGPIVTTLGWRWLFWLPFVVLLASTALASRSLPASPVRTPAVVNLVSAALMVAGVSSLLVGVTEAGPWGWTSPRTGALLALGLALVGAWVRYELASKSPLVDMRMMRQRRVWPTNLAAFLLGFGMYASIAVIPALVELPRATGFGFGGSITVAGLFMLPTALPQLLVGPMAGRIERRIGSRAQLLAGVVLLLAGYAALATAHRTALELVLDSAALGIGLGLGLGALANLIVVAVDRTQTGVATAMNTVMRTLGGAFGAQVTASVIASSSAAGGLPQDGGFTLAFAACAIALAAGVGATLAIPGRRPVAALLPVALGARRAGVWGRIIDALAAAHDAAVQMIDTSIVRVHQHGACIKRNQRQSMGRSRGGLTSKIHAVVDSRGLPVRLALSPGEAHDVRLAGKLLSRLKSGSMVLADRGYDADWIRELAMKKGAWANIPPKSNRIDPICFSPYLYRARNQVERFFNRIKQCRRVATRYDRLAANYLAFVQLASIRLWLRLNESAS